MADKKYAKSKLHATLSDLTKAEPLLMVLSIFLAANIALVRGLHTSVFQVRWPSALQSISLGDVVAFLCFFGLFIPTITYVLKRILVELFLGMLLALKSKIELWLGRDESLHPNHTGAVLRSDLLEKANRESNKYFRDIYDALEEAEAEFWRSSSFALSALVLLSADWYFDRADSISISMFVFLSNKLSFGLAWCSLLCICAVLFWIFLEPLLSAPKIWAYCPGFPDKPNSDSTLP